LSTELVTLKSNTSNLSEGLKIKFKYEYIYSNCVNKNNKMINNYNTCSDENIKINENNNFIFNDIIDKRNDINLNQKRENDKSMMQWLGFDFGCNNCTYCSDMDDTI